MISNRSSIVGLLHQLLCQIRIFQRRLLRPLLLVCPCAVAALRAFVEIVGVVQRRQFGGEFAGVFGAYTVVFGGGEEEGGRIMHARAQVLVGGDFFQERVLGRH